MIPHNMTLFKFICVQYQFHRQTLPIMKIDRGQIPFRDYVSTGTEPFEKWNGESLNKFFSRGMGNILQRLFKSDTLKEICRNWDESLVSHRQVFL